ncbi:MAG: hypothetical protein JWQ98_2821 [Chlorobi bacterium]|nr:hypothetical protein [Chlorobiota bacterium]
MPAGSVSTEIIRRVFTMTISSLFTAAFAISTLFTGIFRGPVPIAHPDPVDGIIGAGGFNQVYPISAGSIADQQRQITARLTYLEDLLRSRDVSGLSPALRAERLRNLDRIHAYRVAGAFPRNFDYPGQGLPCFIDREGTICAVGYLVEQSVGRGVAEEINRNYQYATVAAMRMPALDRWIAVSGLTRAEVITIQEPAMDGGGGAFIGVEDLVQEVRRDTVVSAPVPTRADSSQAASPVGIGETTIH